MCEHAVPVCCKFRLKGRLKAMSHWQVKEESASASRLQKHEITCMKHFHNFEVF